MAANEHPDPQLYQRTRDTLGKVIKKPPLNDKLLSRPPFKYLRDIILEVIKHFSHLVVLPPGCPSYFIQLLLYVLGQQSY